MSSRREPSSAKKGRDTWRRLGNRNAARPRGTGARALRSIFENIMLDIMYDIPSRDDVESVSINRGVVEGTRPPVIRKKRADAV